MGRFRPFPAHRETDNVHRATFNGQNGTADARRETFKSHRDTYKSHRGTVNGRRETFSVQNETANGRRTIRSIENGTATGDRASDSSRRETVSGLRKPVGIGRSKRLGRDVAAEVGAFKLDALHGGVGGGLGSAEIFAERGHAEDASAVGHDLAFFQRRARMEHFCAG